MSTRYEQRSDVDSSQSPNTPGKTRRGVTTRNQVRAWDATTAATHGENICAWTGVAAAASALTWRLGHAVMRAL